MPRTINEYTVHLDGPDGQLVSLKPGDEVPGWADSLVGEHATVGARDEDDTEDGGDDGESDAPSSDGRPSGKASRQDWAAWASKQGAPEADTADGGLTRNELRERYGAQS